MEKLTLIKVGGKIVEQTDSLNMLLKQFSEIEGFKLLVHGGGRSATQLGEKLGLETKMIDGRRITDEETLKIVTMVYAGLVNKTIVAGLQSLGINSLGLTGADLNMIRSEKRPVKDIDYGFVGDVKDVNGDLLASLIKQNIIPVFAPLSHDKKGNILNTNADTIAGELAKALACYFDVSLVFCFEKNGVLMNESDEGSIIPELDKIKFDDLVEKKIIQGGMIPKLQNSFEAIEAGVKEVIITNARDIGKGKGTTIR